MSEKRKRDGDDGSDRKRHKKGFQVGPANLPDGTHRRKVQKIKADLIGKAKIWKDYEKLKKRGEVSEKDESIPIPASIAAELEQEKEEPTVAPHPDRQVLMDKEEEPEQERSQRKPRERRKKEAPFRKEHEQALQRKAEAEERRKAREEAQRQREQKIAEREKFRKAMAKARTGGKNGQRKLGRESQPLLEKVKRMMSET
ncbi:hypothetical protein Slin14017_G034140 [Septoria linicola]|nr:hypothetical protein Slin14017_G034140 [Septoria linicola]